MNNTQEPPGKRTLEIDIPHLIPYLKPGLKVLDVGCGTGTITLGVAEMIQPGEVVGIDPNEQRVNVARDWAAQVAQPNNVTFHVGDSHRLDFPDKTFDLVYSHTVLHFFLDPVMGLMEQHRVAKKGGWVIASGVRDVRLHYPTCPNWDSLYDAFHRFCTNYQENYRASGQDPVTYLKEQYLSSPTGLFYYDMYAGRKCAEWFHHVGLTDVRIAIQPRRVVYQGHEEMKPRTLDLLSLDESESWGEYQHHRERFRAFHQQMIDLGLLDHETIQRATEEARAWYKDPGAFQFWPEIFVAGRVL